MSNFLQWRFVNRNVIFAMQKSQTLLCRYVQLKLRKLLSPLVFYVQLHTITFELHRLTCNVIAIVNLCVQLDYREQLQTVTCKFIGCYLVVYYSAPFFLLLQFTENNYFCTQCRTKHVSDLSTERKKSRTHEP